MPVQISDHLRQMLLCDDSENAELYSDAEKAEFLWRIFAHICLGGACCQFEASGNSCEHCGGQALAFRPSAHATQLLPCC